MIKKISKFAVFSRHSRLLSTVSLMLFFYALFNGLISYILPIQITNLGFSKSQMGLIIASSNIFGAIFDFVLAKYITNTGYRRLYLIVFGLCFIFPLIVFPAKTVPLFLIAMAIWGLYSDLSLYATFDFVSRRTPFDQHCQSFGFISIFRNLGYLIAPIIAGLIVLETIDFFPYSLSLSFVFIALIFYVLLLKFSPKKDSPEYNHQAKYIHHNFFKEFHILRRVARVLFPVIIFNILIYVFDATFWTIGPIFAESFPNFRDFGGFFMTAYTLPVLIVSWFVGPITKKFGKKKTAYYSFLLGCILLLPLGFIKDPLLIIITVFLSSLAGSIAWPAIDGAYADYMTESHCYEKEIISINDFTCNIGYIIGPITAGLMADLVSLQNVFVIMGLVDIAIILYLLTITPRHINVILHRH